MKLKNTTGTFLGSVTSGKDAGKADVTWGNNAQHEEQQMFVRTPAKGLRIVHVR